MLAARGVVIYGGAGIIRIFSVGLPASWQHVMVLGGLRCAVSAALKLLIPGETEEE